MNEELEKTTKGFSNELLTRFSIGALSTMTNSDKVGAISGLFAKHVAPLLAEIERMKKENENSYLKGYEDGFKEKPF